MIRTAIIFLLTLSCSYYSFSQTKIKGQVKNEQGEAVFAANVYLKNDVTIGEVTDFEGYFLLDISDELLGDTLAISYIGYLKTFIPITEINTAKQLNIQLKADDQKLIEVLVKARKPVSEAFAVTQIDRLKIYTTPIAQGDPLKAITALPASTNTDESANPSLRGSAPNRSLVIFNKVPVQSPVRNSQINGTGFFSLLNPEMIEKQLVYASNPPLTYGNASAGLVEVETNKELKTEQIQFSSSLANIGVLGAKAIGKKSFLQAYGNLQFSQGFVGLNRSTLPNLRSFNNLDAGINVNTQLGDKTSLNLFSYGINESYEAFVGVLNFEGAAKGGRLRNFNILNFERTGKATTLSFNVGFDQIRSDYNFGALNIDSRTKDWYFSLHDKWIISPKLTLEFGSSLNHRLYQSNDRVPSDFRTLRPDTDQISIVLDETLTNWEAFLYQKLSLTEKTIVTTGLRTNILPNHSTAYLSFQFGVRQYINDTHSFLLSGGQYHNYNTPNYFIPRFQRLKSQQIALDYTYNLENAQIKTAIFYKREFGDQSQDIFVANEESIFGLELALDKEFSREWSISLANTFINHSIHIDEISYPGTRDLNYFLKATLNYQASSGINAALIYVSRPGLRFTPIVGGQLNEVQNYIPVYNNQINEQRYEPYHNLSFSLSRYKATQTRAFTLYLNVNNILNIHNQSSFFFNESFEERAENFYQLRTIYFGAVWQFKNINL